MFERFDSFYVTYDEVTKTHSMQLCALDEGAFNLKILCHTIRKRVNIKFADNKPTLTLYGMLLKDRSTNGHSCVYTLYFSSA